MLALSTAATRALGAGEIDFALFFSPRTSAIFARLAAAAGVARELRDDYRALDQRRGRRAARHLPWRGRRVADRPDQPALLDLLDRVLAERRQG